MTPAIAYSRPALVRASVALAFVMVGFLGRSVLLRAARLDDRQLRQRAASLGAEVAGRRDYAPVQLQALRRKVKQVRANGAALDAWNRLETRLASHWRPEAASAPSPHPDATHLVGRTFVYLEPRVGDWAEILDCVQDVEALPGLAVDTLEMVAAHDASSRAFATVRMRVVGRPNADETARISHE